MRHVPREYTTYYRNESSPIHTCEFVTCDCVRLRASLSVDARADSITHTYEFVTCIRVWCVGVSVDANARWYIIHKGEFVT